MTDEYTMKDVIDGALIASPDLKLSPNKSQVPFTGRAESYEKMVREFQTRFPHAMKQEYSPGIVAAGSGVMHEFIELAGKQEDASPAEQLKDAQSGNDEGWLNPLALQLQNTPLPPNLKTLSMQLRPVAKKLLDSDEFFKKMEDQNVPIERQQEVLSLVYESARDYESELENSPQGDIQSVPNPNTNLDVMAALYGLAMWSGGTRMVMPVYGYIAGELMQNSPSKQAWLKNDWKLDNTVDRTIVKEENREARAELRTENRQATVEKKISIGETLNERKAAIAELREQQQANNEMSAHKTPTPSPYK